MASGNWEGSSSGQIENKVHVKRPPPNKFTLYISVEISLYISVNDMAHHFLNIYRWILKSIMMTDEKTTRLVL